MKIGKYKVKYVYKPERIISDVLAAAMTIFSVVLAARFVSDHPEIRQEFAQTDFFTLWVFPAVCAAVFAAYFPLTLTDKRFEKRVITPKNAQEVFCRFAFGVSLCRVVVLFAVLNAQLVFEERLISGEDKGLFSFSYVLCALAAVIIIRFTAHRISAIAKADNKSESGAVFVKTYIAEDDRENENEREKK